MSMARLSQVATQGSALWSSWMQPTGPPMHIQPKELHLGGADKLALLTWPVFSFITTKIFDYWFIYQ